MSEIETLQTENEALKAKNAELLDELKRAKKSRESEGLREQVEKLEAEKGELSDQIHQLTFEKPINDFFKEVCPASSALRQTFSEHFDIARGEDGKFYINDKDGNPTLRSVKVGQHGEEHHPRELTLGNLQDLAHENELDDIWFFLPRATGGGAPGSRYPAPPSPKPSDDKPQEKPVNRPQLGMR